MRPWARSAWQLWKIINSELIIIFHNVLLFSVFSSIFKLETSPCFGKLSDYGPLLSPPVLLNHVENDKLSVLILKQKLIWSTSCS